MTSFTNQEFEQLKEKLIRQPNSMLFARLADYYLNRNEVEKALDLTQKGLAWHTEYATGYFILAKCLLRLRHYEEAEKALKKVLLLDSKYLLAHKCHGDLLKDIGGWDNAAEASYRRILEVDPLDEDTRAMLEALKQKQKAATEEEKHYPPVEETEPQPMMPEKLTDEDLLTVTETEETEEEPELSLEQISDRLDPDDDEARFSSILDDIFGEKLAQEERRVEDKRKIIESAVPVARADVYVSRRTDEADETDLDSDLDYPEEADVQAPEIRPDLISPVEKPEPETLPEEPETLFTQISEPKMPASNKSPVSAERDSRLGKKDRIVTPTLGEIYAAQGQYEKAINVFETLLEKQPDSQNYRDKISYLKQKLAEQQNLL